MIFIGKPLRTFPDHGPKHPGDQLFRGGVINTSAEAL
jgi:hypothetical protein